MLKKICRKGSLVVIPLLITVCFFMWYGSFLDAQITEKYNSSIGHKYVLPEIEKGMCLLRRGAQDDNLILLGSSELSSQVPQNPEYMFPNAQLNRNVMMVGQPSVQDLSHAIRIGALSKSLQSKKIVLLVSLQWFMGDGIAADGYQSNFSELQFYNFMNNRKISDRVKEYICGRVSVLTTGESSLLRPNVYATLYQRNTFLSKIALGWIKPYYFLRNKMLFLKDQYQSYQIVQNYADTPVRKPSSVDWKREREKAHKMGKIDCTNNDFHVQDKYFNKYLKDKMAELKNSSKNVTLLDSKEWGDYEALLEICKETQIRPYIVFMPTNGWYYDYIGISQKERDAFYDKLNVTTAEYGYPCLDLSDKEYEPYFLKDVMHLGWKGWLYVNEKITEYYSQDSK